MVTNAAVLDHQAADGHWQPEAARPGAARVEPEDALAHLGERLVRMAEDHDPLSGVRRRTPSSWLKSQGQTPRSLRGSDA